LLVNAEEKSITHLNAINDQWQFGFAA